MTQIPSQPGASPGQTQIASAIRRGTDGTAKILALLELLEQKGILDQDDIFHIEARAIVIDDRFRAQLKTESSEP